MEVYTKRFKKKKKWRSIGGRLKHIQKYIKRLHHRLLYTRFFVSENVWVLKKQGATSQTVVMVFRNAPMP